MAKKMVRVSDLSGGEITDGKGATVRIAFCGCAQGSSSLTSPTTRRTNWVVRAAECHVADGSQGLRPDPEARFTPALAQTIQPEMPATSDLACGPLRP